MEGSSPFRGAPRAHAHEHLWLARAANPQGLWQPPSDHSGRARGQISLILRDAMIYCRYLDEEVGVDRFAFAR